MTQTGDLESWTVNDALIRRAMRDPDRPLLRFVGGRAESCGETYASATRLAAGLQALGVGPGDRVIAMMHNRIEAIHLWLATNLVGAVDVAINAGYRGAPLVHAIEQTGPKVIVIEAGLVPALAAVAAELRAPAIVVVIDEAPRNDLPLAFRTTSFASLCEGAALDAPAALRRSDTASIIFTSGTTGPAKGVVMPHGQVMLIAHRTAHHCRLSQQSVWYSFHPLYHMAGKFMAVLGSLVAGGEVVIDTAFEPAAWISRARHFGATISGGHGPMLEMIFATPPRDDDRNHSLETVCSAPFPRHIARDFEARFGVRGLEVWGMTEIGLPLWNDIAAPLREGSCGRLDAEWFEFAVVDPESDTPVALGVVGEFVVRPKAPWTIMHGYDAMPDKTVEAWRNLWFHTGDRGHLDRDGYVYFAERASERIRRRAENVSAHDIEIAISRHPAVREAAAIGVPSEFAGDDDIELCLVLSQGSEVVPHDLLAYLASALPHYMVPRYLRFMDELPRSVTNKIQRTHLKQSSGGAQRWDRKAHGIVLRDLIGRENGHD